MGVFSLLCKGLSLVFASKMFKSRYLTGLEEKVLSLLELETGG